VVVDTARGIKEVDNFFDLVVEYLQVWTLVHLQTKKGHPRRLVKKQMLAILAMTMKLAPLQVKVPL
jgi:hypothetical protein